MDFITIDFETATADRDSPCEIGLTFVKNNQIVDTKSWLIKPIYYPHFDSFNTWIHGITPNHVSDKPEFNELWTEIKPLIENQFLIAHNAGFDFSVLRRTLDTYELSYPNLSYSCSYIFSKKVWQGLSAYDLKTLCKLNNIKLNHHRAAADSKATAELALKAFELAGVSSIDDFTENLKTTIGRLYEGGYNPSESKRVYKPKDLTKIVGDPSKHQPDSIFYGRSVVFTGTLSSMVRSDAQQIIADIGGFIDNSVTKNTDYLIVGQQDYRVVGDDGMSNKQEKAITLIEKGASLEVISEVDFINNIDRNSKKKDKVATINGTNLSKGDDEVNSASQKLALAFSQEEDIPTRLKSTNKKPDKGKINLVEIRFQENVNNWNSLIEIMLSKVDKEKAWRYINLKPKVEGNLKSASSCQDFQDFTDFFILRRDIEMCDDNELANLALLHTAFQREIENRIKSTPLVSKRQFEVMVG